LIVLVLLTAGLARPAYAVDKIAVLEITGDAAPEEVMLSLSDSLREGARQALPTSDYMVISRENMIAILGDMGIDAACIEGQCEVETARNLRAAIVMSGELIRVDSEYLLTVKLHDVPSGGMLKTEQVWSSSIRELIAQAQDTAYAVIVSGMRLGPSQSNSAGNSAADGRIGGRSNLNLGSTERVAMVRFESTPSGAVVLVDNVLTCQATPCTRELLPGSHRVSMQYERYHPGERRVDVTSDQTVNLELDPAFGVLNITTSPSGLPVNINGDSFGAGPHRLELASDTYEVTVETPCHILTGERVTIAEGENRSIMITPESRMAGVNLRANDGNGNAVRGTLYADGRALGEVPGRIAVPYCSEELSVRSEDGSSWQGDLELVDGEVVDREISLNNSIYESALDAIDLSAVSNRQSWGRLGCSIDALGEGLALLEGGQSSQVVTTSISDSRRTAVPIFLIQGEQITANLISEPADPYLHLYDSSCGTQLASNDDGGDGTNSRIQFSAPSTGTYYFVTRAYSRSGPANLRVTWTNSNAVTQRERYFGQAPSASSNNRNRRPESIRQARAIGRPLNHSAPPYMNLSAIEDLDSWSSLGCAPDRFGQTIPRQEGRGTVNRSITLNDGRTIVPVYLQDNQRMRLDLTSSSDNYLELYDQTCSSRLMANDDGGSGYNASLDFTSSGAATYFIIARPFSSSGRGEAGLRVRFSGGSRSGGSGGGSGLSNPDIANRISFMYVGLYTDVDDFGEPEYWTVWLQPEAIPGLDSLPPIHLGVSSGGGKSLRLHTEYEYGFGDGLFPFSLFAGAYYDTDPGYVGLIGAMAGFRTYLHFDGVQDADIGDLLRFTGYASHDNSTGFTIGAGLEVSWIVPLAILGAAAGSDINLKTNIQRVGTSESGIPTYTFQYRGDPTGTTYFGTMAQDLIQSHPHAVTVTPDGFYAVYYDLIDVNFYPVEIGSGSATGE